MTQSEPEEFLPALADLCASAGVALTLVPALPKLAVSGVTRWIGSEKAAVALSLRHKCDDQLWFSFFHEACHVLERKVSTIYVDAVGDPNSDPDERRADQFARDALIPAEDFDRLVAPGTPTLSEIERFANGVGVSPGIVVGRLQFEGILPPTHGNKLKRWFRWGF